ncbi:MAG: gamma-glutamyl-gamma-aminobutyrate hydrolase family protein [Gammaproteobacteria bacterium]|nr:gamma-glutamyl-gamma-aminobutyrate hydrolase family protein [Gammaproteobacteria bacterium]MCH9716030.1 gamma-glutamyl-gamma-aminobutyrate hydrolase family protein [Gammaproteobacteria bacterium]MCH9763265.1 gamma-glutamyl-gamma-aminobutyrate hydrolase family protein [Gammaproteobacteria bacterium]
MNEYGWLIEHQDISAPAHIKATQKKSKHIILIDHYDSFTQLIKAYFEALGARVSIVQSDDHVVLNNINGLKPTHVVLSPGPGHPEDAKATQAFILKHYKQYPILGICLGHQCLIQAFGGGIMPASEICHGKPFETYHTDEGIFQGITQPFTAARYHSYVSSNDLPEGWHVTAWTHDKRGNRVIMGVQHEDYLMFGVQYHPESVLTSHNSFLFEHFLDC